MHHDHGIILLYGLLISSDDDPSSKPTNRSLLYSDLDGRIMLEAIEQYVALVVTNRHKARVG
jgi:hypothetical protein